MASDGNGLLAMSLDDIIDQNKKAKRNNVVRRKPAPGVKNGAAKHRAPIRGKPLKRVGKPPVRAAPSGSTKIVVSNLAHSVTQEDMRQLFGQIGMVKSAQLNYDANGRSKGVATVIFKHPGDAERAIKEYNNRTLDNRPMRIEVIVSPTIVNNALSRLAPARPNVRGGPIAKKPKTTAGKKAAVQQKKKAAPKPKQEKAKPKTQQELDDEIAAYMSSNTA